MTLRNHVVSQAIDQITPTSSLLHYRVRGAGLSFEQSNFTFLPLCLLQRCPHQQIKVRPEACHNDMACFACCHVSNVDISVSISCPKFFISLFIQNFQTSNIFHRAPILTFRMSFCSFQHALRNVANFISIRVPL